MALTPPSLPDTARSAFERHEWSAAVDALPAADSPEHIAAVQGRFMARGLSCAPIGVVEPGSGVWLQRGAPATDLALLWDWAREPFIVAAPGGRAC